jgi:hypothetical protein
MGCKRCSSDRVVCVDSYYDELTFIVREHAYYDFTPADAKLGGTSYFHFLLCMNCGQVQGTFPLPLTRFETDVITVEKGDLR